MSKFFQALEQAEQERALRRPAEPLFPQRTATTPAPPPELPLVGPSDGVEERGVEEHLVSLLTPVSFEAEQYRGLRHLVEQLHKSAGLSVVAISSPARDDGKTTTAINLAGALAQAPETRVLLVDVDLRGASLARHLGLEETGPGLVDAILNPGLSLQAVIHPRPPFNLSVLPAGHLPSAPYEVLKSPRTGELLAEARRRYDYVVLDTPPLVSIPDCRIIEKLVDGFLVVVAAHRTPRKLLEEALHMTDPGKIVGLVFNGDDRPVSGYRYPYGRSPNGHGMKWPRLRRRGLPSSKLT